MHIHRPYFGVVTVILMGPHDQTVLVIEDRPDPKWKFPGGKIERRGTGGNIEEPWQAAIREVEEETGIILLLAQIQLLEVRYKSARSYYTHFFAALVDGFQNLRPRGVTGERTKLYPLNRLPYDLDVDLLEGKGVLQDHLNFLKRPIWGEARAVV